MVAQIPVSVFNFDDLTEIRDHNQSLPETIPVIYQLNPSKVMNDMGQEVFTVPDGEGAFWVFNRSPDAQVTIRLRKNVVITPESNASVSFMDLKSGSFRIEGPNYLTASELPQLRGFSRESGGGGFINMFDTGFKLELSAVYITDTHADESGGKGGALNLQGGKVSPPGSGSPYPLRTRSWNLPVAIPWPTPSEWLTIAR